MDKALEDFSASLAHLLAESLGRGAETFQVAVLEVHPGPLGAECGERHLNFGAEVGVVPELGVELLRQHQAPRRIPRQHLTPLERRPRRVHTSDR